MLTIPSTSQLTCGQIYVAKPITRVRSVRKIGLWFQSVLRYIGAVAAVVIEAFVVRYQDIIFVTFQYPVVSHLMVPLTISFVPNSIQRAISKSLERDHCSKRYSRVSIWNDRICTVLIQEHVPTHFTLPRSTRCHGSFGACQVELGKGQRHGDGGG